MTDLSTSSSTPLRISRWLLSSILSASVIGGAIAGVAVLFLAQGFFDTGRDPVVPSENAQQTPVRDLVLEKRLQALEARMKKQHAQNPENMATLQENIDRNTQATQALQQRVDAMQNGVNGENRMAQIALGMTQLKNAFENDLSLQPGIDMLKQSVKDVSVEKTLNDLTDIARKDLPSKDDIYTTIEKLQTPEKPQQDNKDLKDNSLTWQDRAKATFAQFVKVQPTQNAETAKLLGTIQQAVNANDFSLAAKLAENLPSTDAAKQLLSQLQIRQQAQFMVQKIVNQLGQAINQTQKQGSSY